MQSVPGRAGLVREDQRRRLGFESSRHLVDVRLARADGANDTGGSVLCPCAWARAIESVWTSRVPR